MSETLRTLTITEAEESVLVEMIQFFNDNGWINESNQTDYDSLSDKVCEPAFWENLEPINIKKSSLFQHF